MATQPDDAPRQASLLGIPRELRLNIYEHVLALDLNHKIASWWRHNHGSAGFTASPELSKEQALSVPWLNLMLACKSTATEISSFMQDSAFKNQQSNTTYVLELEALGGRRLGKTVWKRLPCAPAQTEYLEVHFDASRGFSPWGDGGPAPITSSLYQALNYLIHYGPRMHNSTPLPRPMHLNKVGIDVYNREVKEDKQGDRDTDPEVVALAIGSLVGQINNTGVLKGFVDNIAVRSDTNVLLWHPEDVDGTGIPSLWDRYGFDWGLVQQAHDQERA